MSRVGAQFLWGMLGAALTGLWSTWVFAACPPDCVPGGGPAAADCLVQLAGIGAPSVTCVDGDPSCDADGARDGACRFDVQVCVGIPGPGCDPAGLTGPPTVKPAGGEAARQLDGALSTLDSGCAGASVTLPLVASLARLAPAKLAFTVGASAGSRRDRDRVRLACLPSPAAPSLARTIQPILSARCASSAACHQGPTPAAEPALDPGVSRAGLVGVASLNVPGLDRVQPGSIKRSYLARKVLGRSIPDRSARMPLGCSDVSAPPGGCLTEPETAAILGWIAAGAPDN